MPVADGIIPVIAWTIGNIFESLSNTEIFTGISLLTVFIILFGLEIVHYILIWIAEPEDGN